MTTFSPEALMAKSQVFVKRAVQHHAEGDTVSSHLWCACALELLGKWALASLNPALIADRNEYSLRVACGLPEPQTKPLKTVGAAHVYEMMRRLHRDFDEKLEAAARNMAGARNAELHSGESPAAGLKPRQWQFDFWRSAKIFLGGRGKNLGDWVGTSEGARIDAYLDDEGEHLRHDVLGRIEAQKTRYEAEEDPIGDWQKLCSPWLSVNVEEVDEVVCPACGAKGHLAGSDPEEDVVGVDDDGQDVNVVYAVNEFRCPTCRLRLYGQDELSIAKLPLTFERTEYRRHEWDDPCMDE